MKTFVLAAALLLSDPTAHAQKITTSEAKGHEGENATVCGIVASEHFASRSRGQPTFINLDAAYPHQIFTMLIWDEDRRRIGQLPIVGSHVCVTGLITDYRGGPEVVVKSASQISR
jgi:DNA/RNA endonuclease YhcR with UshA esterase domain